MRALATLLLAMLSSLAAAAEPFRSELRCERAGEHYIVQVHTPVGPCRFIFDTGASTPVVSESLARRAGLASQGEGKRVYDFEANVRSLRRTPMQGFSLGALSLGRCMAYVVPDSLWALRCMGVEGIVGGSALEGMAVMLCERDSLLTIASDASLLAPLPRERSCRMRLYGNRPFVRLLVGQGEAKTRVWVCLDTGASELYFNGPVHQPALERRGALPGAETVQGLAGSYGLYGHVRDSLQLWSRGVVRCMTLAGERFDSVGWVTTYGNISKLGNRIFRRGRGVFDYRRRRFYFLPYAEAPALGARPRTNLEVIFAGGRLIVSRVWDPALAGIEPGDEVVAVDGRSVAGMDICGFLALPQRRGTEFHILSAQGERTVRLRDMDDAEAENER